MIESAEPSALSLVFPCPFCGETQGKSLLSEVCPDSGGNFHTFTMRVCSGCGLGFTVPVPSPLELAGFYPIDYRPHRAKSSNRDEGFRPGWFSGCPERKHLTPFGQGRLLDFGCGGGSYLARMRRQSWSVTGVDASLETCKRLREEQGFAMHSGTLPNPDLPPRSFEVITMWQSLEHVADPLVVLKSARELLVEKGRLFVAVPTWESWNFSRYQKDWYGVDMPRHLIHFTSETLRKTLEKAGFEVLTMQRLNHPEWLRRSARNRMNFQRSLLDSILATKPGARLAAWWVHWILNRADCLYVRALGK